MAAAVVPAPAGPLFAAPALAAVLSPSQASCFAECSARYWFKYGLQLPDPQNTNLALGAAVHTAVAANFAQKVETHEDRPAAEIVERFHAAWAQESYDADFNGDDDADAIAALGGRLVQMYMEEAAHWIQPKAVELHVEGEIAGVRVQGYIDLLEEDGRITDIKTAGRKSSVISTTHAFQLATYATLAKDQGATGEVRIDQLVKSKVPQLVQIARPLTQNELRAPARIYPLVQAAARSGYYVPNRASTLCSRTACPYWRECCAEYGGDVR